ncbi:alpha/beta fold hydrolase [Maribacter sp. 2210JD10-5]|uniref:alpha/beta fold hydrolase n=1 Tax=Maribacter sp. 2210JD10-5 TaxID=3386272 RepID=UPI0039BD0D70
MLTTAIKEIEKGYVQGPFGKLHYWTIGSGEAFFLIHQSSSSSEEYAGLVPYLKDRYQLISFDWPGHGNSDDPAFELGVEEYTKAAITVLDHLKIEKCHILGHHGGALLAMNIAHLQAHRVSKIIFSGTSGPKTKQESEAFKKNLPIKRHHELEKDGSSLLSTWKRFVQYLPNSGTMDVLIPFLNTMWSKLRPYDAHYGVLGWNRNPALQSLKCPVLLIQGENDTFVSRQEKLLELIPNSERVTIPKGGAFLFYELPEKCTEVIRDFLQ